jgi:hypothetical protein
MLARTAQIDLCWRSQQRGAISHAGELEVDSIAAPSCAACDEQRAMAHRLPANPSLETGFDAVSDAPLEILGVGEIVV